MADPASADSVEQQQPLSFREVIGSVFAGAIGVQNSANRRRDFTRGNAIHFIAAGLIFTATLVFAIVSVVTTILANVG